MLFVGRKQLQKDVVSEPKTKKKLPFPAQRANITFATTAREMVEVRVLAETGAKTDDKTIGRTDTAARAA